MVRAVGRTAMAGLVVLTLCGRAEAVTQWIIVVSGHGELRVAAADIAPADDALVDLRALAAALGLVVSGERCDLRVVSRSGEILPLSCAPDDGWPGLRHVAYVPFDLDVPFVSLRALVAHAGGRVVFGEHQHAYVFPSARATTTVPEPDDADPQALASFMIRKTPEQMAEERRLAGALDPVVSVSPRADDILPPQHESFRVEAGAGVVAGSDGAATVAGFGTIKGFRVGLSSFLSLDGTATDLRSVGLSVEHPDGRWRLEGGDLVGELRGLNRGARLSGYFFDRWRPGVALYLQSAFSPLEPTVVAYRDEVTVTPDFTAFGEVASDRSFFAGTQHVLGRGTVETFYRHAASRGADDYGALLSVDLGRGFSANAGVRTSETPEADERWASAGIRIPLGRAAVALDQTRTSGSGADRTASALAVSVPLGPLHITHRYQFATGVLPRGPMPDQQLMQSMAFFSPHRRLQLGYQTVTQWYEGGTARQWDQADATVEVRRGTTVRLTTKVPEILDPQVLRAQLTQALPGNFSLSVEYGAVSAFHPRTAFERVEPRMLVMLRKRFDVPTPAGGGRVRGAVLDDVGAPVPGVAVRVGPYLTTTDAAGHYDLRRVPAGTLPMGVDRARLAAQYERHSGASEVAVVRGTTVTRDLRVIPLNSVGGVVYVDDNQNGRPDEGEGQPGVVLHAVGRATVTDGSGRYRFSNLPPGVYRVEVDVTRLRRDVTAPSPTVLEVVLATGVPAEADFRLTRRQRPVEMQVIGP